LARIVKPPEERRSEIIAAAKELFSTNGYENTTVNDIIQKIGVAKGTFYHYFKSKDEIADAVIQDAIARSVESFKQINAAPDVKAIEKLSKIIGFFSEEAAKHYDDGLMTYLHNENNVKLHLKMKTAMIKEFVPIITDVVRQGVQEDVFHTDFPQEITEFLLVGLHFMLDPSFFSWTYDQFLTKLDAIVEIYEKLLGAPKGSFLLIKEYLKNLH
jgi:AcrR family transcriptional regulator